MIIPTFALLLAAQAAPILTPAVSCREMEQAFAASTNKSVPAPYAIKALQITEMESLCGGWKIIDVWRTWAAGKTTWFARRTAMDRGGRSRTEILDSAGCPAFNDALRKLSDLRLTVALVDPEATARPGSPPPPPEAPPPPDGTWFTLTVLSARQLDRSDSIITAAGTTGPIAQWVAGEIYPLENCWRPVSS